MYTENHVIPLLTKACPGWTRTSASPSVEEKARPFGAMTDLAKYIVDSIQNEHVDEFPKLFKTVELILREGSDKAKELIGAGLIESLQSHSAQNSIDPEFFKIYLGEETRKAWNDIERFWSRRSPI